MEAELEPLPELDWLAIRAAFEAKRREKAASGKPGKTVLVVDDPKPGQSGRMPRFGVFNELPEVKR